MESCGKVKIPAKKSRSFFVTLIAVTAVILVVLLLIRLHFPGCWVVTKVNDSFNSKPGTQPFPSKSKTPVTGYKFDPRSRYIVQTTLRYPKIGNPYLIKGDVIKVLHANKRGQLLIGHVSREKKPSFIPRSFLTHLYSLKMESDEELYEELPKTTPSFHVVLTNYNAENEDEVTVTIDDDVEVLDDNDADYWFVDNLSTEKDGLVPAHLIQKVSEEEYKRSHGDSGKVKDTYNQRINAVNDLVVAERKYVVMLRFLIENHIAEMDADDLPEALRGKQQQLFSNIKEIYVFHSRTFLNELEGCVNEPDEIAAVFLRYKNKLLKYSNYFENRLKAEKLLHQQDILDFFKEFQEDTEDPFFITDYLDEPLKRVNEYKVFLQDLLKFTARANLRCSDIEEALEVASSLSREANTVLHVASLDSYTGEIPLQEAGKFHRQDTVLFWDDKPRGAGKKRELFLFDKLLINARIKNDGEKYLCKFAMKISSLELTENIDGEPTKWAVWIGNSVHNPVVLHTFEAKTVEAKDSWVDAIKELIQHEGGRRASRDEKKGHRHGATLKEKVTPSVGQDDIIREVERQYIIVTSKVPPKVKAKPPKAKPVENEVNNFKEIKLVLDLNGGLNKVVDTTVNRDVEESDMVIEGNEGRKYSVAWQKRDQLSGDDNLMSSPTITKSPQQVVAKISSSGVFTCEFQGDPPPSATWNKEGKTINNGGRFKINTTAKTSSLEIDDVVKTDAGSYQIILKNQWGYAWASASLVIAGTHLPPNITNAPKGLVRGVGGTALFPCNFTGVPQPNITWSKDDVPIKTEDRYLITKMENYTQLEVRDLVKSDKGKYGVYLKNPYGTFSAWAWLAVTGSEETGDKTEDNIAQYDRQITWSSVQRDNEDGIYGYSPPRVTVSPKGMVNRVGEIAIFKCNFTSDPQPSITWSNDGVAITTEGRFFVTIEDNYTALAIHDLHKSDSGTYSLLLKNSYGSYSAWAVLLVTGSENVDVAHDRETVRNNNGSEEAFFIESLQNQTVIKWSALTLTAKIEQTKINPKIVWKKDGKTISPGRAKITYDKGLLSLKYPRVEQADCGKYSVEVTSGKEKHESSSHVKVEAVDQTKSKTTPVAGKNALFANFKQQQTVALNSKKSDEKIAVEVKKETPHVVEKIENVEKEVKQVTEKNDESIGNENIASNAQDDAEFIEKLQDQHGKKWSVVTLTAKIKEPTVKPKITWKKDGKVVGVGRAKATYDKGIATLKFARIEYVDSGLYSVEFDTGSKTFESSATIEVSDIPDPPFPPNATEIRSTSMKVSWRPSNTGNSPIVAYYLEYRANSDKDWSTVDVTSTPYVLEDLTPKTQYKFRVSATNKLGTSKPSRVSSMFQTKV